MPSTFLVVHPGCNSKYIFGRDGDFNSNPDKELHIWDSERIIQQQIVNNMRENCHPFLLLLLSEMNLG